MDSNIDTSSNPAQADINQAVQSANMADTVTTPAQSPTPSSQPQQPQTQAAPTAQPQQPQAQTPQTPKQSLRSHIFDTILAAGAGRPVQGPDGKPVPMTRGIMGKAIIANALAGMMAGYGSSETVNTKFGPVRVNNPAKGFAAGAQAADQQQQQRQQQMDESQARAYNTVKRNLDLHSSMLNLQNATEGTQDKSASDGSTLYDGLKSFDDSNTDPNVPKFILDTGVTGQELNDGMASGKYHIAKNSAILIGWQPHLDGSGNQTKDADGIPQREPLFAVVNPEAIVHFTPELKDALSGMHQDLSRIPDNTAMKAKALLPLLMNKQNYGIAQDAVNGWSKANDELTGKKSENVDVNSLIQSNQTLKRAVPFINKYIGEDPDVVLAGLRKEKDPSAQAAAGILASKLGINEDTWKNKRTQEQADAKRTADQLPANPALVATFKKDIRINNPELTPGQIDSLAKQLGDRPTQKDYKEALEQAGKQADRNMARNAAKTKLDDAGQRQLFDYGVSGETRLNLDNAPDSMLVDSRTGNPIPYKMTTTLKPTMQESNRKDFATSAIHSLDALNNLIATNEAKFGPVTGPVDKWMSQHGLGDQFQQAALNYLTFAQSAATGAHVGGRFNVPIMDKMATTVNVNMDKDQLKGAMDSIKDVTQQYVDQGGRVTVADYRSLKPEERKKLASVGSSQPPQIQTPPVGARPILKNGQTIGYIGTDGKRVNF